MTWDGETYSLTVIGSGVSGIVYSLDDVTVVKVPFNIPQCVQAFEIEREVYRRIAKYSCPYIVKCYDFTHPHGIILEKLENTVRNYIWGIKAAPDEHDTLRWALQAAQGLTFLHSYNIFQADVGCHNMLLTADGQLKICDFSGCSLDGNPSSVSYEVRSTLQPRRRADRQTDIFALGSAIYEMSTGHKPYYDIPECEVMKRFNEGVFPNDFPSSKDQSIYTVIKACWTGEFETAESVVTHLEQITLKLPLFCTISKGAVTNVYSKYAPRTEEGHEVLEHNATIPKSRRTQKIGVWLKKVTTSRF